MSLSFPSQLPTECPADGPSQKTYSGVQLETSLSFSRETSLWAQESSPCWHNTELPEGAQYIHCKAWTRWRLQLWERDKFNQAQIRSESGGTESQYLRLCESFTLLCSRKKAPKPFWLMQIRKLTLNLTLEKIVVGQYEVYKQMSALFLELKHETLYSPGLKKLKLLL